jgi:integrase/recombinase XerC
MIIDKFIIYLKNEKRYSEHTLTAYQQDLQSFSIYTKEIYELDDLSKVNQDVIRSWTVYLMRKGLSNNSINRKIASLKSFYKFLENDFINNEKIINPTKHLITPKKVKRLPSFVKEDEMENLLLSLDGTDFISLRDKAIITLLYVTGIRRSELINLKLKDINLNDEYIKVLGKRKKERIIPINNKVIEILLAYKELKEELFCSNNNFFLTQKGKKLYPKAVYNIVNKHLSTVSTVEQKSPHTIRHSFATHLLNNGAELKAIQDLLGHNSLAATQVYTHTTLHKLKESYRKAHPKANN